MVFLKKIKILLYIYFTTNIVKTIDNIVYPVYNYYRKYDIVFAKKIKKRPLAIVWEREEKKLSVLVVLFCICLGLLIPILFTLLVFLLFKLCNFSNCSECSYTSSLFEHYLQLFNDLSVSERRKLLSYLRSVFEK